MDREDAPALDYAFIQPGRQRDRHAKGLPVAVLDRVPVIEPRKAMRLLSAALRETDVRLDVGGFQAPARILDAFVVIASDGTPDALQQVIGMELYLGGRFPLALK